jgi:hypothetical protein
VDVASEVSALSGAGLLYSAIRAGSAGVKVRVLDHIGTSRAGSSIATIERGPGSSGAAVDEVAMIKIGADGRSRAAPGWFVLEEGALPRPERGASGDAITARDGS